MNITSICRQLESKRDTLKECKIFYVVCYHQYSNNKAESSFKEEQFAEFVDPVPSVARRMAFEFAQSENTYPNKERLVISAKSTQKVTEKADCHKSIINRWCNIKCIEYGAGNTLPVYFEMNDEPEPAFLENLEEELKMYERLGFADNVPTTLVYDRNGKPYKVIAA